MQFQVLFHLFYFFVFIEHKICNHPAIIKYKEDENKFGKIYVYTPYWCRWQFDYEIENGEKQKLTFEFWKKEKNELPDFVIV